MYLKVISKKAVGRSDIRYSCITPYNERVIFNLTGTEPYFFIRKVDAYLLKAEVDVVDRMVDEGFQTLQIEPCYTVYTNDSYAIRRLMDRYGHQYILSGDVKRELSSSIKYNISNYIKIPNGLAGSRELYYGVVKNMTSKERETVVFPDSDEFTANLDIEAISASGDFPKPELKEDLTVCVVVDTMVFLLLKDHADSVNVVKRYRHVMYDKIIEVKIFYSDVRLVEAVYKYLVDNKFQTIIAWNSDFDEEWLKEKSKLNRLNHNWDMFQWFNIQEAYAKNLGFSTTKISLKDSFNLVFQYKRDKWKFLPKNFQDYYKYNSESLIDEVQKDTLAYRYLKMRSGQSGAKVGQMYEDKSFNELTLYNVSDVLDMIALKDVAGVGGFISQAGELELVRFNDVFNHTRKIDPTPLKLAVMNKIASRSMDYSDDREELDVEGAIVHKPDSGKILEDVFVLDFSRFYISIILALQVSPENVPGEDNTPTITVLPDGSKLDKPMFFVEALAYYLIQARENAESGLAQAKLDENNKLIALYTNMKNSYKTVTSGLWGYISTPSSRYFAHHVPDLILGESRNKNIQLKDYINSTTIANYKFRVVYGDTDSSFAQLMGIPSCKNCDRLGGDYERNRICSDCGAEMELLKVPRKEIDFEGMTAQLNEFLVKICNDAGYPRAISVKPEKLFDRLYLVAKKMYYGRVVWEEGFLDKHSYYVKGLQTVRADHSQFAKDFQYGVIITHLDKGEKGLYSFVSERSSRLRHVIKHTDSEGIMEIAKPVSFKASPEHYVYSDVEKKIEKKGSAYKTYGQSALRWNEFVGVDNEDEYLGARSKGKMLPVKSVSINILRTRKWLCFVNPDRIDWKRVQIDKEMLFKQNILNMIENILSASGKSKREIRLMTTGERRDNGMGL